MQKAGAGVWPGDTARDGNLIPGAVFHFKGSSDFNAGHVGGQPVQAGLPGPEHGRAAAGDAGGGAGVPVPVQGAGPLLRPLLWLGHHPH